MTSFAPVAGFPEFVVSSDGVVYGPDGELNNQRTCKGRYYAVQIGGKSRHVHRLVAESFIPNPDDKPDVAHWDNDGTNNEAANLRWATESENMLDKRRHGTATRGSRHYRTKLTEDDVRRIRSLRHNGVRAKDLAAQFDLSVWTIYDMCNPARNRWKSLEEVS